MAINKLSTMPKHLLDPSIIQPMDNFTVPHTIGGSMGGVSITNIAMPNINTKEYAIQGRMLTVEKVLDSYELERTGLSANIKNFEDEIKIDLIRQMMEEIVKGNCIEFTSQKDMLTGAVTYRARIFVTPDTNVRIIRQVQK